MVRLKATKMNLFLIHKKVKQRSTPNQQHRSTPLRLQSNSKQWHLKPLTLLDHLHYDLMSLHQMSTESTETSVETWKLTMEGFSMYPSKTYHILEYAEKIGSVYLNLPRCSVRQNKRRPYPQHLVTIDMLEDMIAWVYTSHDIMMEDTNERLDGICYPIDKRIGWIY